MACMAERCMHMYVPSIIRGYKNNHKKYERTEKGENKKKK